MSSLESSRRREVLTEEELLEEERRNDLALGVITETGDEVLDDVFEFLTRFVACLEVGRVAAALWIMHTHVFEAADVSPRLAFLSAEPQSGKTRFMELLKLLVREPLFAVNVSEAALFRVIEARTPTILHDEIDAVFGPKARDREDLRAMLNAGYERGATVERCVGEGTKLTVKSFPVFTPVAMAGLGKLPETVETRTIRVAMKRRAPDEPVAKLRRRQVVPEADMLRARLAAWGARHVEMLGSAEPPVPDELDDRSSDIWEPLLAIADAAGGTWPARARVAARALYGARRDDEATIGVRLLTDIARVFDTDALSSGDLASRLAAIEGAAWGDWSERGFTAHALAKLLKRYDIRPGVHRRGPDVLRGYLANDFADAWSRYLPAETVTTVTTVTPETLQGLASNSPNTCNTSPERVPPRRHHPRLEELADELDRQLGDHDDALSELMHAAEELGDSDRVADLRAADVIRRRRTSSLRAVGACE